MAEGINLLGNIEQLKKQIGLENQAVAQREQAAFDPLAAQIQAQFMNLGVDKDPRVMSAQAVQTEFKTNLEKTGDMKKALETSARSLLKQGNLEGAQFLIDRLNAENARELEYKQAQATLDKTISETAENKEQTGKLKAERAALWQTFNKNEKLTPMEIQTARATLDKVLMDLEFYAMEKGADLAAQGAQTEATAELARARRLRRETVERAKSELVQEGQITKQTMEELMAVGVLAGTDKDISEKILEQTDFLKGSQRPNRRETPARPQAPAAAAAETVVID